MVCASSGTARVALGAEISAFFCKNEDVAAKMHSLSGNVFDQVTPPYQLVQSYHTTYQVLVSVVGYQVPGTHYVVRSALGMG